MLALFQIIVFRETRPAPGGELKMTSIEEVYHQMSNNLTVRYVMTPRDKFVYYEDPGYEEYDIVPVRGDDGLQHY